MPYRTPSLFGSHGESGGEILSAFCSNLSAFCPPFANLNLNANLNRICPPFVRLLSALCPNFVLLRQNSERRSKIPNVVNLTGESDSL